MGSLHRTTFITAAVLICGLATLAFAQDAATLCPNDRDGQELIEWIRQRKMDYSDIVHLCQTLQQRGQPQPADLTSVARKVRFKHNVEVANGLMKAKPGLGKQCLDAYMDKMDDPSSFQWRDGFVLDEISTYLAKDFGILSALATDIGNPFEFQDRMVAFGTTVRGKNGFGALVRTTLKCWYVVDNDTMLFDHVAWQTGQ
jgi:hypothetical protein